MKSAIFTFTLFFATFTCLNAMCPFDACEKTNCSGVFEEVLLCEGRIEPYGSNCGCCPVCVKLLDEGDECSNDGVVGITRTTECRKGLACHPLTSKCVKSESFRGPCHSEVFEKERDLSNGAAVSLKYLHLPECLDNGFYFPVQCQSDVCRCVGRYGNQLDNIEVPISRRDEINCQCVRDKDDRKPSVYTFSGVCDKLGNYESVKCEYDRCFCIDKKGKRIVALPDVDESLKDQLGDCKAKTPCQKQLESIIQSDPLLGQRVELCRPDGTYNPRQCFAASCNCIDGKGELIPGYRTHVSKAENMTCNCAHDKANYQQTEMIGKTFSCDNLGNYHKIQCLGSVCHCVDEFGVKLENSTSVSIGNYNALKC